MMLCKIFVIIVVWLKIDLRKYSLLIFPDTINGEKFFFKAPLENSDGLHFKTEPHVPVHQQVLTRIYKGIVP